MSWHTATGLTVSITVTVAEQVEAFAFESVTVSTATLVPTSAQPKLFGATARLAMPHASLEPPSTSPAVILALPLPSR